jgi:hypothetical protein
MEVSRHFRETVIHLDLYTVWLSERLFDDGKKVKVSYLAPSHWKSLHRFRNSGQQNFILSPGNSLYDFSQLDSSTHSFAALPFSCIHLPLQNLSTPKENNRKWAEMRDTFIAMYCVRGITGDVLPAALCSGSLILRSFFAASWCINCSNGVIKLIITEQRVFEWIITEVIYILWRL